MSVTMLADARAEALFVSDAQPSDNLDADQVRDLVRRTVKAQRVRGCAALVAYEFGEHPDTATARMRWANQVVEATYPHRPVRREMVWSRRAVAA